MFLSVSSTVSAAQADVIAHGVVLPEWAPETGAAVIPSIEVQHVFAAWLSVNASLTLQSLFATCMNDSVCTAAVSSSQGGSLSSAPAQITAQFVCLSAGSTEVQVTMGLRGFDPVTFGFTKRCGGTLLIEL